MFRLDNILEQWAGYYTPLSHGKVLSGALEHRTVVRKTFFRISMIDANSYFVRNFAQQPSPAMAYATHIDAEMTKQNPKAVSYRHVVYMMAKQQNADGKTDVSDDEAATEARFLTDAMTQDLLAFLVTMKGLANGKAIPADVAEGLPAELVSYMQQTAQDNDYREGLRGLQLDDAHWGTLPTHLNGWQLCGLTIEQIIPRALCLNAARY